MDTFIVGRHTGKIIQRVLKINASTKSLVERLCDFKIYAISVLSFIGSVCAPDKAALKAETHAHQCTTAGPYNAIRSNLLGVGSVCGLGPDLVGIHSFSLAPRYRVAACSTTLCQGHVAQDCTSLCCHPLVVPRSLPHLALTASTSFRRTIHTCRAKIHGREADQHKSHLSQVMSPK